MLSVDEASISVSHWAMDGEATTMRDFFLPPLIYDEHIVNVIPKPTLSSLIIVHHAEDFLSFKSRYVFGMQDVFCTREPVNLRYPPQSLSTIIFDGILWIVSELNRLLSNRRQSQDLFASFSRKFFCLNLGVPAREVANPCHTKRKNLHFFYHNG